MEVQQSIAVATWVYTILTGAIFLVFFLTARVAQRQLRLMRHDSLRQLVKNLMEQWMTDKMVDARDKLGQILKQEAEKSQSKAHQAELLKQKLNELEEARSPLLSHLLRIPHYFEMVSTLVESDDKALKGFIGLFRETIIRYYEIYKLWIDEKRKAEHLERLYIEFEKLYKHALTARKKG